MIHHNEDLGVTIQGDLGDNDLLTILNTENKNDLLERSLEILLQIQIYLILAKEIMNLQ